MDFAEEFLEKLEESIRLIYEEEKEKHPKAIGKYYPSSIGDCLRKQFYEFFEEKEPSKEELTIFFTGKSIHEMLSSVLNRRIKIEAVEMETSLDFGEAMLQGRVDIIIASLDGEKIIIELKTVSELPDKAKERHVLQLQCYLHALNIEKGILLYWDKRRGGKKAFPILKDQRYLDILKERTLTLHKHVLNKIEPIREFAKLGNYRACLRCPYREKCMPLELDIEKGSELVVSEIDNVLFNTEERRKACLKELGFNDVDLRNLDKENKEKFFELFYSEKYLNLDIPVHEKIRELDEEYLKNNRRIVIVTNRPEKLRKATEEQLISIGIPFEEIFMRKENQKSFKFKSLVIKLLEISGYKVMRIFDDEKSIERIKREILSLEGYSKSKETAV